MMKFVAAAVASVLLVACAFVVISSGPTSTSTPVTSQTANTQLELTHVTSTSSQPSGHISGHGKCSSSQLAKVKAAVSAAAPDIKRAVESRSSPYFTKWFGKPTSKEPDSDVYTRLTRAQDKFDNQDDWEAECCPASGSTDSECASACGGSTLAFVMSASSQGQKKSYNQIRFCAAAFSLTTKQLGFTIFHESVHLMSGAGDGTGAYDKKSLVQLAKTDPDQARRTANSYTLYAMQTGIPTHAEYETESAAWGGSTTDGTCNNKYSNCADLVSRLQCATQTLSDGSPLIKSCCEACTMLQPPGSPPRCTDKYSNCASLGSTQRACDSGTLSTGETIGEACCKSCGAGK